MSVVPRSLCAVDGSLYIPADKASLIHATEGAKAQTVPSVTQNDATQTQPPKVLIAAAILKTVKSPYFCNRLTDFDEIWHGDAHSPPTADRA